MARYWDSVAIDWITSPRQTLWRAHSDVVNARLIDHWLPAEQVGRIFKTDLFDEGAGEGLYSLLARRARNAVGGDISVRMTRAAKSRCPGLAATVADVRALPCAGGVFDAVVSNSTLDHFVSKAEIVESLQEIHRVLRTGGHLLLTLDNPRNPVVALRNVLPIRALNRLGVVPYRVGATFGPRRLRRVLEQCGFEVLDVRTVMHCPRAPAIALLGMFEHLARPRMRARLLAVLGSFERLARWPSHFLTGYFVAVHAVKRGATGDH
jgi:SAM-dependent methyltransferase